MFHRAGFSSGNLHLGELAWNLGQEQVILAEVFRGSQQYFQKNAP
jgi:hypothetical protein